MASSPTSCIRKTGARRSPATAHRRERLEHRIGHRREVGQRGIGSGPGARRQEPIGGLGVTVERGRHGLVERGRRPAREDGRSDDRPQPIAQRLVGQGAEDQLQRRTAGKLAGLPGLWPAVGDDGPAGDRRQQRPGVGIGTEGIHVGEPVGDPWVRGGDERHARARGEAGQADPIGIHLGARGDRGHGLDEVRRRLGTDPAGSQLGVGGHGDDQADAGQRHRRPDHGRVIQRDLVDAQREQDGRQSLALGRGSREIDVEPVGDGLSVALRGARRARGEG